MLLNDFYTIDAMQAEGSSLSCRIIFNAAHDIFRGHFPGQPVVPGVCTMQIIKELLELHTGSKLLMRQAAQVKFLQLLTPDALPQVTVTWVKEDGGYSANAVIKNNGHTDVFKMAARFIPSAAG